MKKHILFRGIRKLLRTTPYTTEYVDYFGQAANDYIVSRIKSAKTGLMISIFGTIELDNVVCNIVNTNGISLQDYKNALKGVYSIHTDEALGKICNNAGFSLRMKD